MLAVVDKAAMNVDVQISLWVHTKVKFLDHMIILFIISSHHVNFRRDFPILYSYQQHTKIPAPSHTHQHLFSVGFFFDESPQWV